MNRASFFYAGALIALATVTSGCARRVDGGWYRAGQPMGEPGAVSDGWTRITPPGTGMAFLLPTAPRVQANQEIQDDGTPVTLTRASCETPFANFVVSVMDSDGGLYGDPLREADHVAERIAGNLELQDRRTTRLDVAGFYGREEVGRTAEGVFVAIRIYIGVRRVYVAFAATPAGGEVGAAERFMGSVELDAADALYPVASENTAAAPWSPLFMPEDDFAVRMPVITGVTTTQVHVGDASSSMRTYEALADGTHYRVRVLPFEGTLPELVDVSSALNLGVTVRPAHASGYPGVEVRRENAAGNKSLLIRTTTRIYVMEVETASNIDEATSRTFFDSLRIL